MLGELLFELESAIRNGQNPPIEHYLLRITSIRDQRRLLRELLRCESSIRQTRPKKLKERIAKFPELLKNSRVIRSLLWGVYNDLWQEGIRLSWADYVEYGESPESLRLFLQGDTPRYYLGQTIHRRYRLEQRVGAGEGSVVFKAWDILLQNWVALKLLNVASAARRELFQNLFKREFQLNQKVRGPGIISIRNCIAESDYGYLVMDYMPNGSLRDLLNAGPISPRNAVLILMPITETLVRLHSRRIWHRDLKPANILLNHQNLPIVADLGLGLEQHEQWSLDGQLAGSYPYMSPNRLFGQVADLDGRSDIYSVGMMLYEMTHGRRPFLESDRETSLVFGLSSLSTGISINESLPDPLKNIIRRCLQRERNMRYDCVQDLLDDLHAFEALQAE
jgi:serine/threonine protein kinase